MGKSDQEFPMAAFVSFPYIGFDNKYWVRSQQGIEAYKVFWTCSYALDTHK